MQKHPLNFEKAKQYFLENLKGTNRLSDSVISFLKFESGDFFALLTDSSRLEDVHNFYAGGKTRCLIHEVGNFVCKWVQSHRDVMCVFDDFNSDMRNIEGDALFRSNGLSFFGEVYYARLGF